MIIRNDGLPKWLGWAGLIVHRCLGHPAIELFGIEANLFLATISVTLWLFAVGLVMIWTGVKQRGV